MFMVPARHILVQISTGPQDQVYSLNPKDGNSPLDWYALQPPGYGDGMPEPLLAFDRTLVMDSLALTGMVLCDLADEAAGRPCSELLPSLSALYERLVALRASQPEARC
jgi:hypothetical protein